MTSLPIDPAEWSPACKGGPTDTEAPGLYEVSLRDVQRVGREELVYLASPYSASGPHKKEIEEDRFRHASWAAGILHRNGVMAFSPIAHGHALAEMVHLPGDWDYWERSARLHVQRSDRLWILALSGWKDSTGVMAEVEIAAQEELPMGLVSIDLLTSMASGTRHEQHKTQTPQ
jgi:hypothetical protein